MHTMRWGDFYEILDQKLQIKLPLFHVFLGFYGFNFWKYLFMLIKQHHWYLVERNIPQNKIWFYLLAELINNYLIFSFCFSQGITNMFQVTVSPVSANNLLPVHLLAYTSACICTHLLHIIAWVIPQCKTCWSATKATGSQGLCLSGSVHDQE